MDTTDTSDAAGTTRTPGPVGIAAHSHGLGRGPAHPVSAHLRTVIAAVLGQDVMVAYAPNARMRAPLCRCCCSLLRAQRDGHGGEQRASNRGEPTPQTVSYAPGMVGLQGRVTGTIGPGLVGEVIVRVRGGAEHFLAYAMEAGERIETGTLIVVVEYQAPRTVYVSRFG